MQHADILGIIANIVCSTDKVCKMEVKSRTMSVQLPVQRESRIPRWVQCCTINEGVYDERASCACRAQLGNP